MTMEDLHQSMMKSMDLVLEQNEQVAREFVAGLPGIAQPYGPYVSLEDLEKIAGRVSVTEVFHKDEGHIIHRRSGFRDHAIGFPQGDLTLCLAAPFPVSTKLEIGVREKHFFHRYLPLELHEGRGQYAAEIDFPFATFGTDDYGKCPWHPMPDKETIIAHMQGNALADLQARLEMELQIPALLTFDSQHGWSVAYGSFDDVPVVFLARKEGSHPSTRKARESLLPYDAKEFPGVSAFKEVLAGLNRASAREQGLWAAIASDIHRHRFPYVPSDPRERLEWRASMPRPVERESFKIRAGCVTHTVEPFLDFPEQTAGVIGYICYKTNEYVAKHPERFGARQ
jgi:hypothetical protein